MKKLILASLIATALTACGGSDSSEPVEPDPDYKWMQSTTVSNTYVSFLVNYDSDCNTGMECKLAAVDIGSTIDPYVSMPINEINQWQGNERFKKVSVSSGFYGLNGGGADRTYTHTTDFQYYSYFATDGGLSSIRVDVGDDSGSLRILATTSAQSEFECEFNTVKETAYCRLPNEGDELHEVDIDFSIFPAAPVLSIVPSGSLGDHYKGEYTVTLLNYTLNQLGMNSL